MTKSEALKMEREELTKEYHDLLLGIKDNDLFMKLNKLVADISSNSFCRGMEIVKEIYNI